MKALTQKNTLLQVATSQPTKQSLQESIFSSTQEKLKNKKFPTLQKNKTSPTHGANLTVTASNVNRFGQSVCKLDTTNQRPDRRASGNKVLPKAGVTCFYDTFVLNQTFVFQIKSSAKTPRLRQYPKRWHN